jgi:hypothetical protein
MTGAAPSPERLAHDRVVRELEQLVDALGGIGLPYRVEGLLAKLERNGAIGASERIAGEEFGRLFRLAALDPLRAADLGQRLGQVAYGAHPSEWARGRVNLALDALGGLHSPCGSAAWYVLGLQLTVREWAIREGWGGRPISPHVAKGTLLGALGVLRQHFWL